MLLEHKAVPDNLIEKITLGADPEFILWDTATKRLVAANTVIPGALIGKLGYDEHGTQAEVRPDPSCHPTNVMLNIRDLLHCPQAKAVNHLAWYAGNGAAGEVTGGHIHLGVLGLSGAGPMKIQIKPRDFGMLLSYLLVPVAFMLSTNKALDGRKGVSEGLDHRDGARQDGQAGRYGFLGDVRAQTYGLEYRTLPSWLYSPATTRFFLRSTKALAIELARKNIDYSSCGSIAFADFLYYQKAETIRSYFAKQVPVCLDYLAQLPYNKGNKEFESDATEVFKMIQDGTTWDEVDFKGNWAGKLDARQEEPKSSTPVPPKIDWEHLPPISDEIINSGEDWEIFPEVRRAR